MELPPAVVIRILADHAAKALVGMDPDNVKKAMSLAQAMDE